MFSDPDGWVNLIDSLTAECDKKIDCNLDYALLERPNLSEFCQAEYDRRIDPNGPLAQVMIL